MSQPALMSEPTPETRPLPVLAQTALRLAQAVFMQDVNALGLQTLAAMDLKPEEWVVDFDKGVVVRRDG